METRFTAIAPGRLCLFGEHQDYLGFPVIALAVPLLCCKIDVAVTIANMTDNTGDDEKYDGHGDHIVFHLRLPEALGGETKVYDMDDLPPSPPTTQQEADKDYDFALAAIHEVMTEKILNSYDGVEKASGDGKHRKRRVDVRCTSTIGELPLRAGCSSSTAFILQLSFWS